jgi:hypothetical protein
LKEGVGDKRDAKRPDGVTSAKLKGLPDILIDGLRLVVQGGFELLVNPCIRTAAAVKKNERASDMRSISDLKIGYWPK